MQSARMFGNYVNFLAEENRLSHSDLSRALGCSDFQMELLLKGRAYASFGQVSKLAEKNCCQEIQNSTTQLLSTV